MGRECAACGEYLDDDEFSSNQWRKGDGESRCYDCVDSNYFGGPRRTCAGCQCELDSEQFSNNQWCKGEGVSRCYGCVDSRQFKCPTCSRFFTNQNALNQHMQVHRPRNVSCPVCGITKFKCGADAVLHVESGYCPGCRGTKANAREQIFKFAAQKPAMRRFLTETPRLTYGGQVIGRAPEFPYQCPECYTAYRQLSQLLQHRDARHGNDHRLLLN